MNKILLLVATLLAYTFSVWAINGHLVACSQKKTESQTKLSDDESAITCAYESRLIYLSDAMKQRQTGLIQNQSGREEENGEK